MPEPGLGCGSCLLPVSHGKPLAVLTEQLLAIHGASASRCSCIQASHSTGFPLPWGCMGLRFGVNLKYPRSSESHNSLCEARILSAAVIKSVPAQTGYLWHFIEANTIKVWSHTSGCGMGETGEFAKGNVKDETSS